MPYTSECIWERPRHVINVLMRLSCHVALLGVIHAVYMQQQKHFETVPAVKLVVLYWRFHNMGTSGRVDRVLDLRSEGLGFDFHCYSCVEMSGKRLIPYCLCPSSSNGYLVERKVGKLWMALAAENALNSPHGRWDRIRESSNTRGVKCKVCWTHSDIKL